MGSKFIWIPDGRVATGAGGWEKQKNSSGSDRGATLAERSCVLFVDETKKNGLSEFKALKRAV